jgi:hypothetical protein
VMALCFEGIEPLNEALLLSVLLHLGLNTGS